MKAREKAKIDKQVKQYNRIRRQFWDSRKEELSHWQENKDNLDQLAMESIKVLRRKQHIEKMKHLFGEELKKAREELYDCFTQKERGLLTARDARVRHPEAEARPVLGHSERP